MSASFHHGFHTHLPRHSAVTRRRNEQSPKTLKTTRCVSDIGNQRMEKEFQLILKELILSLDNSGVVVCFGFLWLAISTSGGFCKQFVNIL
jgi:hypothetical protein